MLDMFVFWLSYVGLYLFWWTGIIILLINIVDWYLGKVSEGDLENVFGCKVEKFLYKIGIEFVDDDKVHPLDITAFFGMVVTVIIYIRLYFIEGASTLHEITVKIATLISETATLPVVCVIGLIVLHKTTKKLYKLGKKVKPLVDKLNKEGK